MRTYSAKRLQRARGVDPLYVKSLIEARLRSVGYKESRHQYVLSTDLEFIYNGCINVIGTMNELMRPIDPSADGVLRAVSGLGVDLDDLQHHIKESKRSLERLAERAALVSEKSEERG